MKAIKSSTRTHLLVWLLLFLFLLLVTHSLNAQPENLNARDPYLREGKMFNLVITPKNGKTEIFVTGTKVADFRFTDVGLLARVKAGKRVIVLSPRKETSSFVLEGVPTTGQMELKLKHKAAEEKFEVELENLR